jgi:hypothetical protein
MKIFSLFFCSVLLVVMSGSCFSVKYDFKGGAAIDPKIKTLSIQFFNNRATRINPILSQSFTDGLRAYMESNTNLRVINTMGDVDFSGEITRYDYASMGVVAGDVAAKTRFTIAIRVKFTNSVNPKNSFDTNFSSFRDFDSMVSFSSVESDLTKEIINEIIDQIFNKAFVNW